MPTNVSEVVRTGALTVKYQDQAVKFHPETETSQITDFLETLNGRYVKRPAAGYAADYVLPLNYLGVETDTKMMKIGDGVTEWEVLDYIGGSGGGGTNNPPLIKTLAEWNQYHQVVQSGRLCFTSDAIGLKIGDGLHEWSDLPYMIHKGLFTAPFSIEVYDENNDSWNAADVEYYGFTLEDNNS